MLRHSTLNIGLIKLIIISPGIYGAVKLVSMALKYRPNEIYLSLAASWAVLSSFVLIDYLNAAYFMSRSMSTYSYPSPPVVLCCTWYAFCAYNVFAESCSPLFGWIFATFGPGLGSMCHCCSRSKSRSFPLNGVSAAFEIRRERRCGKGTYVFALMFAATLALMYRGDLAEHAPYSGTEWLSRSLSFTRYKTNVAPVDVRPASPLTPLAPQAILKPVPEHDQELWLVDGLLRDSSSPLSETPDWNHLYWFIWHERAHDFLDRHYSALELVFLNDPQAIIFMVSSTLRTDFFDAYLDHGYQIYVVKMSQELVDKRQWYTGPNARAWLSKWDDLEHGSPFFKFHLSDYLRCFLIYQYGGTYLDFDSLWLRSPPYPDLEFVGSDYSTPGSDQSWKLDKITGLYIKNGIIRSRAGNDMFRRIAEAAVDPKNYVSGCFDCLGSRAFTAYVQTHRKELEKSGFAVLTPEVHYPYAIQEVEEILQAKPEDKSQELAMTALESLYTYSWSLHLFGKMTDRYELERNSPVDILLRMMSLGIPHSPGLSHISTSVKASTLVTRPEQAFSIRAPDTYIYHNSSTILAGSLLIPTALDLSEQILRSKRAISNIGPSLDGRWEGLEKVFVRGGSATVERATVLLLLRNATSHQGTRQYDRGGNISIEEGSPEANIWYPGIQRVFEGSGEGLRNATKRDINYLLSALRYQPPALAALTPAPEEDRLVFAEDLVITIDYGDLGSVERIVRITADL
ncbi:hypothetical protein BP5796_05290 [Coleophoma crateriformis]|uniref:Alpha 1,4-glycosyltransferase domain-containing protein n=1 Tax=Coleophoma crateriformis TaxID=565419 RepID=A0A3D8S2R7_9HELO|nr:hypothetical protein BP5796_05290 [Coleophoma crateriformis]